MFQHVEKNLSGRPIMSRSGLEASQCGLRYDRLYNQGMSDDSIYSHRGCVTPGHRVLTADLRWVPVETLKVGDKIIGMDEFPSQRKHRRWRIGVVTRAEIASAPVATLFLSDGTKVTSTLDHPWLVRTGAGRVGRPWVDDQRELRKAGWITTEELIRRKDKYQLLKFVTTWNDPSSHREGWLSGFFDGEGSLSVMTEKRTGRTRFRVTVSQNEGPTLDLLLSHLTSEGFNYNHSRKPGGRICHNVNLKGGTPGMFEFLGHIRPSRLLRKLNVDTDIEKHSVDSPDVGLTVIGAVVLSGQQPIVSLSTSIKTYMVEGLASHNTAFHAVRRRYIERLVAAQTGMDEEEAGLAFAEGIAEAGTPPQVVPEVRNIFARHVEHFELNLDAYVSHEKRVVRLEAVTPYQFEPDLVYAWSDRQELEVQDEKTWFRAITEAQARELLQTRYYIWCAMQEWPGFLTYRMTYSYPRLNAYTTVVFSRDDFDMLNREIVALEANRLLRYETHNWEAVPGDQCAFCHLACDYMDDPRRLAVRVNSPESFKEAAGAKLVLEKQVKTITAALKSYATVEGSQNVNGEVFDFRPSVSRSYPIASVVDRLREKGAEAQANLAYVTASALKGLFKVLPWLQGDLAAIASEKVTQRFGHKSMKSETRSKGDDEDEE